MKTQAQLWNECYSVPQVWYPNEYVVRFAAKYIRRRIGYDHHQIIDGDIIKVMDLGCGAGRHVAFFAENGCTAFGIDLSETAISVASQRLAEAGLKADLRVGTSACLPWDDSSLDAVVSCGVLDHMLPEDCEKSVAEVHRILRDQGLFYLDLVSKDEYSFGEGTKVDTDTFELDEGQEKGLVQRFFDEESISAMLSPRFEILDCVKATVQPLIGRGFCSLEVQAECSLSRYHIAARRKSET